MLIFKTSFFIHNLAGLLKIDSVRSVGSTSLDSNAEYKLKKTSSKKICFTNETPN